MLRKNSSLQEEKLITKLKEAKRCIVKKKSKFIFFTERELKLYEDGCLAYFGVKTKELKKLFKQPELQNVCTDGKTKMKIITPQKTYYFKFSNSQQAEDWVSSIKKLSTLEKK